MATRDYFAMTSRLAILARLPLPLLFLLPNLAMGALYNYEAYGNTLDGPPGTVSGCSSQSFVSQTLSVSNCSSAAGVLTSGSSLATFSGLHVSSSTTLSNALLPNGIFNSGYSRTVDQLTVSPGVEFVGFTIHLDGTLADAGLTQSRIVFSFGFNYDGGGVSGFVPFQCGDSIASGSKSIDVTCTTPAYPVSFFDNYSYFFSLSAMEQQTGSASPRSGTASANFFNSATIVSVQPYDSSMNYIPDAIVASLGNNGTAFANAQVPEPSTLLLLSCGGLALVGSRLRRGA